MKGNLHLVNGNLDLEDKKKNEWFVPVCALGMRPCAIARNSPTLLSGAGFRGSGPPRPGFLGKVNVFLLLVNSFYRKYLVYIIK